MSIKDKILQLIREDDSDLPTLPITINKIIRVASDKHSTIEELEEAISYDQAMTSKLLRLSNSMYYAQKSKVDTIKRAISVIGFDEIIGIALGMEILSSFNRSAGKDLDMGSLWMHSIGVAIAAKELTKRSHPNLAGKIFIPALLHDIGKVFFSVYFKREYTIVQKFAFEKKKNLYLAENAILKMNHALLSGLLMKRWKFPKSIELPCRFHHNPESAPIQYSLESFILNLADYVSQKAGIGLKGPVSPKIQEDSLKAIGVTQPRLELIIDQLRRKKQEINDFFEITAQG